MKNLVLYEWVKHIKAECHFIRDHILTDTIATTHVFSIDQLTNILKKTLGWKEFEIFNTSWAFKLVCSKLKEKYYDIFSCISIIVIY